MSSACTSHTGEGHLFDGVRRRVSQARQGESSLSVTAFGISGFRWTATVRGKAGIGPYFRTIAPNDSQVVSMPITSLPLMVNTIQRGLFFLSIPTTAKSILVSLAFLIGLP